MDRLPLRELFASAAPEVPDWYQPPKIKDPIPPTPAQEISGPAKTWVDGGMFPSFSNMFYQRLGDPYYRGYRDLAVKFENEMREWVTMCSDVKKQNEQDRYFSWRWYYADKMLEAMEKKF